MRQKSTGLTPRNCVALREVCFGRAWVSLVVTDRQDIEFKVTGERWFVARSLPHKEMPASARLKAQGFQTFLPMRDRTIRHARRLLTVRRPVFPRYVFIRFDPQTARWRSINGTIGLERLLMRGDHPEPVVPGVVESMLASVDDEDRLQYQQPLRPGASVRLLNGPFAEELGVLDHLGPDCRVRVLLSFIGGRVSVEVDRSSLVLAS